MLFEKPLKQPIANWNISHDKFIFQETTYSSELYLVKLFDDSEAILFKFKLPDNAHKGRNRVNTVYSRDEGRFIIPQDHEIDHSEYLMSNTSLLGHSEMDCDDILEG